MPSTLVHLGLGAVLAAALLWRAYDARSLAVVLGATAFPDLDTFLGLWIRGGHRAILHTVLLPLALGALLVWDLRLRERSWLRGRWGDRGARTAGVAVAALAVAGIGPDLFTNGVNVFYPVHDQFYEVTGKAVLSDQRGLVQTFVDLSPPSTGEGETSVVGTSVGSTNDTHYSTGVDPTSGDEPTDVERTFLLVHSGMQLLVVALGVAVSSVRLYEERVRDR
jgi:hypothetical protein